MFHIHKSSTYVNNFVTVLTSNDLLNDMQKKHSISPSVLMHMHIAQHLVKGQQITKLKWKYLQLINTAF